MTVFIKMTTFINFNSIYLSIIIYYFGQDLYNIIKYEVYFEYD